MSFAGKWMKREVTIMLSEISQTEKVLCVFSSLKKLGGEKE
jgi:hypothetical protein